jgi:hypothetical protein
MRGNKSQALAELQYELQLLIEPKGEAEKKWSEIGQEGESILLRWIDKKLGSIPHEDKEWLKDAIKHAFRVFTKEIITLSKQMSSYEEIIMTIDPDDLEPSPVLDQDRIRRQNPNSGWQPFDPEWFKWSDN